MKRPTGFTISALILTWLAITGFMNAWEILTSMDSEVSRSLGYIAVLYASTAFLSAIGLWLMRQWSLLAIRSWMGTFILFLMVPEDMRNKIMQGGIAGMLGFFVFIVVLFWLFDRYVKSKLSITIT